MEEEIQMKRNNLYLFASTVGLLGLLTAGCSNNTQNSAKNNSSVMETKKSSSVTNSKSVKSTSEETKNNQNNMTSNNYKKDDNGEVTVANIDPKTLAATILLLGGEKNEGWKSIATQGSLEVNVIQDSSDNDNYSDPGTGVSYMFTSEGNNYGEILEYRLSSDGSTVYCYAQRSRDSAIRHVTPFATLSAKEIQQAKDSTAVKDLASKMEVKTLED